MASVGDRLKDLEGRPKGEDGKNQPREFFWDSIVLFVVFSIIGLTAIDVISEYVRGSSVQCFAVLNDLNGSTTDPESYINNFCASSVSVSQYFPVFMVVHGILIGIPHYLWLNHYGGSFEFFFQLTSSLDRLRDFKTGEHSKNNYLTAEQLEDAFATYKRNWIFNLYVTKLFLQWFLAAVGFIVAIVYFTDFSENFSCPRSLNETFDNPKWPLPNQQVHCVFTSLRLIELIRIADLFLLAIVMLGLTWSLLWCFSIHSNELGSNDVAHFSFQSGLAPKHYVSSLPGVIQRFVDLVPWPFFVRGPRIKTDLDFMVMKLFRTDGGLGHVLREVQIYKEIKSLCKDERRKLHLHIREQKLSCGDLIDKEDARSDLKWRFMTVPGGVYQRFHPWSDSLKLIVPNSIRGAVLGFAALSPGSKSALYITFGSPSYSFADALGRVFDRVGCINFSRYYNPDKDEPVNADVDIQGITTVTCTEDFLTADNPDQGQNGQTLLDECGSFWIGETVPNVDYPPKIPTSFVVIGALDKNTHKTTVNLFLAMLIKEGYIADDVVLLSIRPWSISGKTVKDDFYLCIPPAKHFKCCSEIQVKVLEKAKQLPWYALEIDIALSAILAEAEQREAEKKAAEVESTKQKEAKEEKGAKVQTVRAKTHRQISLEMDDKAMLKEEDDSSAKTKLLETTKPEIEQQKPSVQPGDQTSFTLTDLEKSGEYSLVLFEAAASSGDSNQGDDSPQLKTWGIFEKDKTCESVKRYNLPLLVENNPVEFQFSLYKRYF